MSALSSSSPTPLPTRPPTPHLLDPRQLMDASQIPAQLALLSQRESDLSLALNALIADRARIELTLDQLRRVSLDVDRLTLDLSGSRRNGASYASSSSKLRSVRDDYLDDDDLGLVERVRRVWETSENVGGKVRRLDDEISRVREATDVVSEVLELKVSA